MQTNANINNTQCKHLNNNIKKYLCNFCNKGFDMRQYKYSHQKSCKNKLGLTVIKETEIINLKNEVSKLHDETRNLLDTKQIKINNLQNKVNKLEKENKVLVPKTNYPINNHLIDIIIDKSKIIEELKNTELNDIQSVSISPSELSELKNKDTPLIELYKEIKLKDQKIKLLEDLYIKRQNRKNYPDKNVIYLVTTEDNKNKRIYIIGKAINLKNRLSIYNKTAEHEVVYYKSCKNEEIMNIVECMVLIKLKEYKEKANRDRFILPIEKDVTFFTNIIDNCINFF